MVLPWRLGFEYCIFMWCDLSPSIGDLYVGCICVVCSGIGEACSRYQRVYLVLYLLLEMCGVCRVVL